MVGMLLGSRTMKPPTDADGVLSLSLSRRDDVVTPGSSVAATIHDANVLTITPATTDTAWDVVASAVHLGRIVPAIVTCTGTGAIASGRLTRVSDGDCVVTAKSGMFIKKETVSMLRASGQTVNQWQSWVSGCLAGAIQQTIAVDLPFWRGSGYGFTAVSPRHVIGCEHIYYMPPTLTLGGVTRNLVSSVTVGPNNGSDGWKSDLMIGKYDGDFPSYAKVFPSTLYNYMPNLSLKGVPAIVCNQFGEKIQRLTGIVNQSQSKLSLVKINSSDTNIIGGDSGNPCFLVLGGEPILLGTLTQGGSGGVTTIHDQIAEVNAAMTELGGGYQLTQVNLSGYSSYV